MEALFKRAFSDGYDAVIAANPAAQYWDIGRSKAISHHTWMSRELSSNTASSGAILDNREYVIPGHENPERHILAVLGYLKDRITKNAQVDFVATGYSAFALLKGFCEDYDFWKSYLHAGVLAETSHSIEDFSSASFREFVRKRCRNFVLNNELVGTFLEPNLHTAVATFSSGESDNAADVVPAILGHLFDYFKKAQELDTKKKTSENQDEEEELNPNVPIIVGREFGSAHEEWVEALQKLNLGEEKPGWTVDGADEVDRLRKVADEHEEAINQIKAQAQAQGKDVFVYKET